MIFLLYKNTTVNHFYYYDRQNAWIYTVPHGMQNVLCPRSPTQTSIGVCVCVRTIYSESIHDSETGVSLSATFDSESNAITIHHNTWQEYR